MHSAIFFCYSFLDELLDEKTIDELIVNVLVFYLSTVDGVSSDLLGNEETGGDVDEMVVFCYFFAESSSSAERSSSDEDLGGDSWYGLNGLNGEGILDGDRSTSNSLMMNSSDRLLERSISKYCL